MRSPRNTAYWLTRPARRLTAGLRPAPEIVIAGAQKSGTTYLAEVLATQPGFYLPPIKEIHYFNGRWDRGDAWYRSHFAVRWRGLRQVDASPSYMILESTPERILATSPEARIVFVLRDPVSRAHSHFQHNVRAGLEDLDFAAALAAEDERISDARAALRRGDTAAGMPFALYSYRTRGLYADFLANFYEVFPAARILVLDSERIFRHDPDELRLLEDFLGCSIDMTGHERLSRNAGSYAAEPDATKRDLRAFYQPWDEQLRELTGRTFSWMENADQSA